MKRSYRNTEYGDCRTVVTAFSVSVLMAISFEYSTACGSRLVRMLPLRDRRRIFPRDPSTPGESPPIRGIARMGAIASPYAHNWLTDIEGFLQHRSRRPGGL